MVSLTHSHVHVLQLTKGSKFCKTEANLVNSGTKIQNHQSSWTKSFFMHVKASYVNRDRKAAG